MAGTKRASPGTDKEKALLTAELSEAEAKKLTDIRKDIQRAELILGTLIFVTHVNEEERTISS